MKKIFIICLLLLVGTFFVGCSGVKDVSAMQKIRDRDKLIVGVNFEARPFGYVEKGEVKGFDVDLAKIIAKEILGDERKVEFRQVTPASRILSLNSEEIDVIIAAMSITSQRKEVVSFTYPYFMSGQILLVPNGSKLRSIAELNNKRVVVILGSTGERNVKHYAPNAIVQGYRTYNEAFFALKGKRADAMVGDETILSWFAKKNNGFKALPKRYTQEPYAIAFRKGAESQELGMVLNNIVEDLNEKLVFKQLENKWGI